ncbi:hypothetical protein PR048_002019 [Dryococelus australis]|uniref:Uncharacterized protein n=1 Tax=Dryococelus australis TaxID=614101 RepID=A0ABQ9IIY7_9NEOP|nr:hypothetical protein PR048_002019 [Dryococelus australis]
MLAPALILDHRVCMVPYSSGTLLQLCIFHHSLAPALMMDHFVFRMMVRLPHFAISVPEYLNEALPGSPIFPAPLVWTARSPHHEVSSVAEKCYYMLDNLKYAVRQALPRVAPGTLRRGKKLHLSENTSVQLQEAMKLVYDLQRLISCYVEHDQCRPPRRLSLEMKGGNPLLMCDGHQSVLAVTRDHHFIDRQLSTRPVKTRESW